jgi:hypothetical protein
MFLRKHDEIGGLALSGSLAWWRRAEAASAVSQEI